MSMPCNPIYKRTFGVIEVKIWCYPREVLKCLLDRLKCNPITVDKVISLFCFRHWQDCEEGGCNCEEDIEEACEREAPTLATEGQVYLPLEVVDCGPPRRRVFLALLKSHPRPREGPQRRTFKVCREKNNHRQCLLRLSTNKSKIINKNEFKNDNCDNKYNKTIKELLKNLSTEFFCDKNYVDKKEILQICLQNNISTENILLILKEINNKKKLKIICKNCGEKNFTPFFECNNKNLCDVTLPRKSSLSNNDDLDGDCDKFSNTKSNQNLKSKYSQSKSNQNIKELKNILNDFITSESCNKRNVCNTFRNIGSRGICDEEKERLSAEEILCDILQHVSQCKFKVTDLWKNKEINNCEKINQHINSTQTDFTENIQSDRKILKSNKKCSNQILMKLNKQKNEFEPILDAYDSNNQILTTHEICRPTETDKKQEAIKHALKVAGIPVGLSDYISNITPSKFNEGMTNIYYYINNDTEKVMTKSNGAKVDIVCEPEYIIEQQISQKESDYEDNLSSSYSHIIVDINIQEMESKCEKYNEQDQINEKQIKKLKTIYSQTSEPGKAIKNSKSSQNSKMTQPIVIFRNSMTSQPLSDNKYLCQFSANDGGHFDVGINLKSTDKQSLTCKSNSTVDEKPEPSSFNKNSKVNRQLNPNKTSSIISERIVNETLTPKQCKINHEGKVKKCIIDKYLNNWST